MSERGALARRCDGSLRRECWVRYAVEIICREVCMRMEVLGNNILRFFAKI